MKNLIDIKKFAPCEYNPRKIEKTALDRLIDSLKEHSKAVGGTSELIRLAASVTINKNGFRIIGGHQRIEALKRIGAKYIHEDDITWVDVEPNSAREKALNISLNNSEAAGEFDNLNKLLSEIEIEDEELYNDLDFGFLETVERESATEEQQPGIVADVETSLQIEPPQEYVIIICDKGEAGEKQFAELREKLNLGMVRRGGYARGSAFDSIGVKRIIKAKEILDRLGVA